MFSPVSPAGLLLACLLLLSYSPLHPLSYAMVATELDVPPSPAGTLPINKDVWHAAGRQEVCGGAKKGVLAETTLVRFKGASQIDVSSGQSSDTNESEVTGVVVGQSSGVNENEVAPSGEGTPPGNGILQ